MYVLRTFTCFVINMRVFIQKIPYYDNVDFQNKRKTSQIKRGRQLVRRNSIKADMMTGRMTVTSICPIALIKYSFVRTIT